MVQTLVILTVARALHQGTSDKVRGVFAGGRLGDSNNSNTMDYITMASAGNATDFGDLNIYVRQYHGNSYF